MQYTNPAYYILNPENANCGHGYHQPPVDIRRRGEATPTRDRLERLNPTYIRARAIHYMRNTSACAYARIIYILYYFN